MMSTFATGAPALSPLTPKLSADTRVDLLGGRTQAGVAEIAHNSVVIAISGGLGFEAANGPISYQTIYPHLPIVNGRVTRVSDKCSHVDVRAWLPNESEENPVVVEGTYCLVGPAEWASSNQSIGRSRRMLR